MTGAVTYKSRIEILCREAIFINPVIRDIGLIPQADGLVNYANGINLSSIQENI